MSDVLTSTYSNQSSGVREMGSTIFEDVDNMIHNISPEDTTFLSAIGKGKATNIMHEWLEDELAAPAANAAIEGADAVAAAITPAARLSNYTQILTKSFLVSGSLEATKKIGRSSEIAYQMEKKTTELAKDLDFAALNNASSNAGAAGTARQMKGLEGFVSTNDKSYSSYATTNDFDEAKFMEMAQAAYEAGGKPSLLLLPPNQARKVANWDGNSRITVNTNASEKTLIMAVMVLETPYGRVKVAIHRYTTQDTSTVKYDRVYLIDPGMCSVAYLRPMKFEKLAKTGDSDKYLGTVEATFVCHNEKAHAKCKKCATD